MTGAYNLTTGQATAQAFVAAASQPANCIPGAIKVAGLCRFDLVDRNDLIPKSDRDNFFARGTMDFSATLSGFVEGGFNRTKTFFRGNPRQTTDGLVWYSSTQKKLVNAQDFLPVGHPNNPFTTPIILRHSFTEVGNRDQTVTAEAKRFVAGLKGVVGPIDWESAILYSENTTDVYRPNNILAAPYSAGIRNGTYNLLNPSLGTTTPDMIRINLRDTSKSSFTIYDAKGSMELAQLSGGPLALAAGLEHRREDRVATPDAAVVRGDVIGFGDGDQIMALLATRWAEEGRLKGGTLVATVMSNLGLERHLASRGLRLERTAVGDRYVVEAMRRGGFNLGGEQSGHIVMTDYATTGDGLIAGLQFLAEMARTGRPASDLIRQFDTVPQVLQNVRFAAGARPLDAAHVQAVIAGHEAGIAGKGRILIRKSGTEPLIRVMAECEDEALLHRIVADIVAAVEAAV